LQGFVSALVEHCAARLANLFDSQGGFTLEALETGLRFHRSRIYTHKHLRINYTRTDVKRAQDTLTVDRDNRDIMLLTPDDDPTCTTQPFQYARIQRIIHANVWHYSPGSSICPCPVRLDLLWVRWFRPVRSVQLGWDRDELPRLSFIPVTEDGAFGFIDPAQVLRAAHLIPDFAGSRTDKLLGPSQFRDSEGDWASYYVGM